MSRAVRRLALAALVLAATGCTPLYVPPVPSSVSFEQPVRLGRESSLDATSGRLVAVLAVDGVEAPGWLSLQWFDPGLDEVASDSVWLEPTEDTIHLRVGMPDHVTPSPGRWRVVVSYRGVVVRQLDAVVAPS